MTTTKKTDKEATLRCVWLVTYRGRGDRDTVYAGRVVCSDAYEVYSDRLLALQAVATVLRGWCNEPGYIFNVPLSHRINELLQQEDYNGARMCWNTYAEVYHEPAGVYGIDIEEVELDAARKIVKGAERATSSYSVRECSEDYDGTEDSGSDIEEEPSDLTEFEHDTTYAVEKALETGNFNPGPNKDGTHPWDDIFIAYDDETFTCGRCTPATVDISLDETQVWEVGSSGWLKPVVCRECKTSIQVIVDGNDSEDD